MTKETAGRRYMRLSEEYWDHFLRRDLGPTPLSELWLESDNIMNEMMLQANEAAEIERSGDIEAAMITDRWLCWVFRSCGFWTSLHSCVSRVVLQGG